MSTYRPSPALVQAAQQVISDACAAGVAHAPYAVAEALDAADAAKVAVDAVDAVYAAANAADAAAEVANAVNAAQEARRAANAAYTTYTTYTTCTAYAAYAEYAALAPVMAEREAIDALRAASFALRATATVGRSLRGRESSQWRAVMGRWRGAGSRRLVRVACVLLPAGARERYREEWTSTVAELGTRRSRARFAVLLLPGAVQMALVLRRKAPGRRAVW